MTTFNFPIYGVHVRQPWSMKVHKVSLYANVATCMYVRTCMYCLANVATCMYVRTYCHANVATCMYVRTRTRHSVLPTPMMMSYLGRTVQIQHVR